MDTDPHQTEEVTLEASEAEASVSDVRSEGSEFDATDQLGNLLIMGAVAMLVALALIIAFNQGSSDEEPRREIERPFIEERDEPEDLPVRLENCDRDFSDAEEQFAPECDDDVRNRIVRTEVPDDHRDHADHDDDRPGLFPEEG